MKIYTKDDKTILDYSIDFKILDLIKNKTFFLTSLDYGDANSRLNLEYFIENKKILFYINTSNIVSIDSLDLVNSLKSMIKIDKFIENSNNKFYGFDFIFFKKYTINENIQLKTYHACLDFIVFVKSFSKDAQDDEDKTHMYFIKALYKKLTQNELNIKNSLPISYYYKWQKDLEIENLLNNDNNDYLNEILLYVLNGLQINNDKNSKLKIIIKFIFLSIKENIYLIVSCLSFFLLFVWLLIQNNIPLKRDKNPTELINNYYRSLNKLDIKYLSSMDTVSELSYISVLLGNISKNTKHVLNIKDYHNDKSLIKNNQIYGIENLKIYDKIEKLENGNLVYKIEFDYYFSSKRKGEFIINKYHYLENLELEKKGVYYYIKSIKDDIVIQQSQ